MNISAFLSFLLLLRTESCEIMRWLILEPKSFCCRLVSCGRNNIRLWRLKDSSLRSAAVPLAEHHTQEFTDICWDFEPSVAADIRRKPADERKM